MSENRFDVLVEYLDDEELEREHRKCLQMEEAAILYGGTVQPYYLRLKAAVEYELTKRLLLS